MVSLAVVISEKTCTVCGYYMYIGLILYMLIALILVTVGIELSNRQSSLK